MSPPHIFMLDLFLKIKLFKPAKRKKGEIPSATRKKSQEEERGSGSLFEVVKTGKASLQVTRYMPVTLFLLIFCVNSVPFFSLVSLTWSLNHFFLKWCAGYMLVI